MKERNFIKIKALWVMMLILAVTLTSSAVNAQKTTKKDILNQFQQDKKRIGRTDQEIKETMNGVVADLKKKNKKFS